MVGVFHAEGDVGDQFRPSQDIRRSGAELRCGVAGEEERQLQNQIRVAAQGHLGARPFVGDPGETPLSEVRGQNDDEQGAGQAVPHRRHVEKMAVVEGVVFGDDADDGYFRACFFHDISITPFGEPGESSRGGWRDKNQEAAGFGFRRPRRAGM